MTPERTERIKRVLNHRRGDLTVVLENVHDPHNIAAVMRSCDAVGVQEIYVLNNLISRHKKFGKKSSASAAGWLTVHQYDNTEACMAAVRNRFDHIWATHLGAESKSLYDIDLTGKIALVFGNEHAGLTKECLEYCTGNFIIPQVGMVRSLNISVACAISLYEAYRQKSAAGLYNGQPSLPQDTYDMLAHKWGLMPDDPTS